MHLLLAPKLRCWFHCVRVCTHIDIVINIQGMRGFLIVCHQCESYIHVRGPRHGRRPIHSNRTRRLIATHTNNIMWHGIINGARPIITSRYRARNIGRMVVTGRGCITYIRMSTMFVVSDVVGTRTQTIGIATTARSPCSTPLCQLVNMDCTILIM